MTEKPDYEAMYQCLNERYGELQKENMRLRKDLETNENYQDKLHDEIDNLRRVIALLSKDWL